MWCLSFGVKGAKLAERLRQNLKLAQIATHVADARTCVLHPANATHRQMNDEELAAAGISPISQGFRAVSKIPATSLPTSSGPFRLLSRYIGTDAAT